MPSNRRMGCRFIQELFAWAIASDNKTIVGTDMDRYFSHHARLAG
jgi:hypothetical protein